MNFSANTFSEYGLDLDHKDIVFDEKRNVVNSFDSVSFEKEICYLLGPGYQNQLIYVKAIYTFVVGIKGF